MSHVAILGRQPELGLLELESMLGATNIEPFGRQAAVLSEAVPIDRLGGALKVARVIARMRTDEPVCLIFAVMRDIEQLAEREGKLTFGLSVYGGRSGLAEIRSAGQQLKQHLAKQKGSVRYVMPKGRTALTAAQLKFNGVLDRGFELLVVYGGDEAVVAVTSSVQDIDWYSKRDYGRPARSARVGMLPPKLAQIMLNATRTASVYDPFCGTGVVLQEALLMGRPAAGSDLATDMVSASQANLTWLAAQVPTPLPGWHVAAGDARQITLPPDAAVVSEGYLGPNLTRSPTPAELAAMRRELLELYRASLANWQRQLPSGGEVSLAVPAWRVGRAWHYLGLVDELGSLGYTLKSFEHVRTPLLYAREDQVVGRQLLLLRKL